MALDWEQMTELTEEQRRLIWQTGGRIRIQAKDFQDYCYTITPIKNGKGFAVNFVEGKNPSKYVGYIPAHSRRNVAHTAKSTFDRNSVEFKLFEYVWYNWKNKQKLDEKCLVFGMFSAMGD